MRLYREQVPTLAAPARSRYAILATAAVVAETDEEAERLASTIDLNFVRRAKGVYAPLESPEAALAYDYSPIDRERIAQEPRTAVRSARPATVKARLEPADRGNAGR